MSCAPPCRARVRLGLSLLALPIPAKRNQPDSTTLVIISECTDARKGMFLVEYPCKPHQLEGETPCGNLGITLDQYGTKLLNSG